MCRTARSTGSAPDVVRPRVIKPGAGAEREQRPPPALEVAQPAGRAVKARRPVRVPPVEFVVKQRLDAERVELSHQLPPSRLRDEALAVVVKNLDHEPQLELQELTIGKLKPNVRRPVRARGDVLQIRLDRRIRVTDPDAMATPRVERVDMPIAQADPVAGRKLAIRRAADPGQDTARSRRGVHELFQRRLARWCHCRSCARHNRAFAAARGHPATSHATVGAITSSGVCAATQPALSTGRPSAIHRSAWPWHRRAWNRPHGAVNPVRTSTVRVVFAGDDLDPVLPRDDILVP